MKRITLLTWLLALNFASYSSTVKSKPPAHVQIMSKRMDVVYFKVDREFVGAELEIYNAAGEKLFTQKVEQRKVLIDFYYGDEGRYTIVLKKGDILEEFEFRKGNPCLETERPAEVITVIQGV
jgi:hypothetical protein